MKRALSTLIRFARTSRGAIAVEAAFAFPVILVAFFIAAELASMTITMQVTRGGEAPLRGVRGPV